MRNTFILISFLFLIAVAVYFMQTGNASPLPHQRIKPTDVQATEVRPSTIVPETTNTPQGVGGGEGVVTLPVQVVDSYYAAFNECMQHPPSAAAGKVSLYCQSHNDYAGSKLEANLEDQTGKGFVPVVCAQNPPESIAPTGTPEITDTQANIILREKFGQETVDVTYQLQPEGEGNTWKVQNILCP
jgi:hypothetical protein